MLNLEKTERFIILLLITILIAGLLFRFYQKSNQIIDVKIRSFDYEGADREIRKVNINEADETALIKLPGIGPSLAKRIIEYRSANGYFRSADDIKKVKGIGDKMFGRIKDEIAIE
ncbi:MAG: ComEA family DNA-binding protein [Candidatus Omnitrophica bacterium]|nr:ComEA family DNA-binding protein [Candidatus Omnitrophota bacterium]